MLTAALARERPFLFASYAAIFFPRLRGKWRAQRDEGGAVHVLIVS